MGQTYTTDMFSGCNDENIDNIKRYKLGHLCDAVLNGHNERVTNDSYFAGTMLSSAKHIVRKKLSMLIFDKLGMIYDNENREYTGHPPLPIDLLNDVSFDLSDQEIEPKHGSTIIEAVESKMECIDARDENYKSITMDFKQSPNWQDYPYMKIWPYTGVVVFKRSYVDELTFRDWKVTLIMHNKNKVYSIDEYIGCFEKVGIVGTVIPNLIKMIIGYL